MFRWNSYITYWQQVSETEINWELVWDTLNDSMQGRKQKDFPWKCIHKAIYTETRLNKMNSSDGNCILCKDNPKKLQHLLYDCKTIRNLWNRIFKLIKQKLLPQTQCNFKNVLCG